MAYARQCFVNAYKTRVYHMPITMTDQTSEREAGQAKKTWARTPSYEYSPSFLMCKFFAKGRCLKGDACRYAHDEKELFYPFTYKRTACIKNARGEPCGRSPCPFLHIGERRGIPSQLPVTAACRDDGPPGLEVMAAADTHSCMTMAAVPAAPAGAVSGVPLLTTAAPAPMPLQMVPAVDQLQLQPVMLCSAPVPITTETGVVLQPQMQLQSQLQAPQLYVNSANVCVTANDVPWIVQIV